MHCATLNEFDLCKYMLGSIKDNFARTSDLPVQENGLIAKADLRNSKGQAMVDRPVANPQQVDEEEETIISSKSQLKKLQEKENGLIVKGGQNGHKEQRNPNSETKFGIDLARTDIHGKSVIHYIITPVDYGSFENDKFLEYMLAQGFKADIRDNSGFLPQDYAVKQSTGVMLFILQENGAASKDLEVNTDITSYRKLQDWEELDYLKDAQDFLDLVKMNVDKENLVPCDPAGKFNDDCIVYEDPEQGYYDCHLTRVDIGREERDDYLFYKLQIVYDKGRDLWLLFTRWGRIGEEGAFQKTPYSKEECVEQFEKIFLAKTKNEWKDRENFKKQWWKYQLTNINYSNVSHQDYLAPFDFSNSKPSKLHPAVQEIMKEITQVSMYVKGIKNSGIDTDQMPFSNINRKDLLKARESLTKLREILEELEPMELQLNRFDKVGKDKIVALREKMWYHSSRFYEMIPHEQFKNEIVPPINKMSMLKEKADMIDNLINFEMASKILLGAHKNSMDVNPLDYCMQAMGVEIDALDKSSTEFQTLKEYCVRTWPEDKQASRRIRNIFKIQRKGEGESFEDFSHLGNKFLLFHGSKISNFMGIMAQGLRVAPPEAPKTGYMFGKGVYFADMLQKSYAYCNDFNAQHDGSKFMLLCETAVGKSYKLTHAQYMDEPPVGYDSTQGLGKSGPCYSKCFTFPEGYRIPKGKYLEYEYSDDINRNVYLRHNEFIIYNKQSNDENKIVIPTSNPGQIKMRYLIQIK